MKDQRIITPESVALLLIIHAVIIPVWVIMCAHSVREIIAIEAVCVAVWGIIVLSVEGRL